MGLTKYSLFTGTPLYIFPESNGSAPPQSFALSPPWC